MSDHPNVALYNLRNQRADTLRFRLRQRAEMCDASVVYAYDPDDVPGDCDEWIGPGYYYTREGARWEILAPTWDKAEPRVAEIVREHRRPRRLESAREALGVFLQVIAAIAPFAIEAIKGGKK